MFKLASFALIAAVGTAGVVQACPSVSVGVDFPLVRAVPRIAYPEFVYRPYVVDNDRDWHREHEGYWHREREREHARDRYEYGHHRGERDWDRDRDRDRR
jgi:hypothetical protein